MQLQHEFVVAADPDQVYAFLLDVDRVVTCMPGAELTDRVDESTFTGKVKVKVGPITASYNGKARILDRDDAARVAVLEAEGKELRGGGSAKATTTMRVSSAGVDGSRVAIEAEYDVRGRVAQFGRGVMEEVSKMLIDQMADCIAGKVVATPASGAVARPGETVAAGADEKAPAVNGLKLALAAIGRWLRGLFRRRESH